MRTITDELINKIAFHEAGHLVMDVLIESCNFKAYERVVFRKPTSIWINTKDSTGQVSGSGFPIDTLGEYLIEEYDIHNIGRTTFYRNYPNFALLNSLALMSGHVFEAFFNRKERLDAYTFGNEIGERSDSEKFKRVFTFLIKTEHDPNDSSGYDDEFQEQSLRLRGEILKLCNLKNIQEATRLIVEELKKTHQDENHMIVIEGDDFNILYNKLTKLLDNIKLEEVVHIFC